MTNHRIGIAFFYHESHTFSPVKTDIRAFEQECLVEGDDILSTFRGTRTEVGGFIDVLEQNGAAVVPLVCAAAIPSGTVTASAYETIEERMLAAIGRAQPLDGILLALHGAMVVEGLADPEGRLLSRIRAIVGADLPIATTLDLHANVTRQMVEQTPMQFGFKTYPHVDMYEQGVRAASLLLHSLAAKQVYHASFIKLPMMPPSINMLTQEGPMHDLVELARAAEEREGIVNVSVFGGFPYSDIPDVGASILVIAADKPAGDRVARFLADKMWDQRERFLLSLPGIQEAVDEALRWEGDRPIVLADVSDNPLSGGTGDTTGLLSELLSRRVRNALFGALYDPETLDACRRAGEGAELTLWLGGKHSPEFGAPVEVPAKVIRLSDGRFRNQGPMNTGLLVDTNGAAHIRVEGIDLLITGRALSANDPELFRHIGIEPTEKRILALKVKNHFRAAFKPLVGRIINVDAPGLASNKLRNFLYRHIPRPIWPIDDWKGDLPWRKGGHTA
ncbi:M81 family metallopeptidase [Kyrpidia sp.]|uniref:M81 family metallopeptidase n=1 Tax=Kyrpidia sp. TaxID=2073077 RepID=UPI002588BCF2|nr:M81 family metallopeptidase [Kyrpidia sp.]MCL6576425.1 M81 family metallopeptidase [Kyrpidia sp.]